MQVSTDVRMELSKLRLNLDSVKNEYQVCRQKLESKCDALRILSQDLDQCRQQRDQFKLMAEQVQQRYQSLKRQLAGVEPRTTEVDGFGFSEMKQQTLAQLLCDMRDANKCLQFEVDDLKQKLKDAQGDIKLLREQIARQRVGTTDEGMNTRHFPAHEREDLVKQLEAAGEHCCQLERDLQSILDEKEEEVKERDAYRNKYERLNHELNYILKGDERRIVDIDALGMDNRYLQERLKQMEEEKSVAMATISKYKGLLERKKNKGILKLGEHRSVGVVVSQKQVHQLLESRSCMTPTPQMMVDLQSLSRALLDTLNDKNMALSHQRKTNKILGSRVSELEKKLKTLEMSGLWNVPDKGHVLGRLRTECEEIRTLLPEPSSPNGSDTAKASSLSPGSSRKSSIDELPSSPESGPLTRRGPSESGPSEIGPLTRSGPLMSGLGLSMEDLDLLPTKEATPTSDLSAGDSAVSATRVGASPLATGSGGAFGDISSEFENLLGEATRIACDHTKKTANTASKNGHDSPLGPDVNPSSLRVHYNFDQ